MRRSRTSGPIDQIGAVSQGWGNLPNPKKLLERTRSLVFGREDSDSDSDASGPSHDAITSVLLRMEFLSDWEYTIFVLCIFFASSIVIAGFIMYASRDDLYIQTPGGSWSTDLATLISWWLIFFCTFSCFGTVGLYIERIMAVRKHEWVQNQWRLCWTTLIIACTSFLFMLSYMGLYTYAIVGGNECPFQSKVSAIISALHWLFVIIYYTCVNAQVIDHTIDLDGNLRRRRLKFSSNLKKMLFQSRFLHLPNIAMAIAGVVNFVIDIIPTITTSTDTFSRRCSNYIAASDIDKPSTEFCTDFTKIQAYGVVGESIITLAYFFMFLVYTLIAYSRLLQVPWTQYRCINISFRILIIQTLPVLLTFAVSSAIHAFRNVRLFEHCASTGWRTTPEICIALAVWIFIRCYCTSPLMRGEYVESIRSTTVRTYLWVEPGDRVIETRPFWEFHIGDSTHNRDRINYGKKKTLATQPVFVFETMVKMLFWSELIYLKEGEDSTEPIREIRDEKYIDEQESSNINVASVKGKKTLRRRATAFADMRKDLSEEWDRGSKTNNTDPVTGKKISFGDGLAMGMEQYNLEYFKIFHESNSESKVVVAWNSKGIIVISFRGTVELANMLTDLTLIRTTWRAMEAKAYKNIKGLRNVLRRYWEKPTIHHGFKKAMNSQNVGLELTDFVTSLATNFIEEGKFRPCIRLTGHSLGGALAILMSYEIFHNCEGVGLKSEEVSVYTFGCPGVCNRSARNVYQSGIPTAFNILNGVDFIAYVGTWMQYQKPGIPVLINSFGDLIYRPSKVESSMHHFWFREKLSDHFLASYRKSVEKIIELNCAEEEAGILIKANPLLSSKWIRGPGLGDEVKGRLTTAVHQVNSSTKEGFQQINSKSKEEAAAISKMTGLSAVSGMIGLTRLGFLNSLSKEDAEDEAKDEAKDEARKVDEMKRQQEWDAELDIQIEKVDSSI
ncbi:hypothetical protein TrVE_jg10990 [Triparma verrucosa]|uniref:Fungal lipase-type domain-containing protein n=1 Tax=Triparma verrucosa TaxID=1606542 RepID=A0A9W7BX18_9STRA|nr:hypothetical protein TrVE_jg10990 [Triparma verrucosa]